MMCIKTREKIENNETLNFLVSGICFFPIINNKTIRKKK